VKKKNNSENLRAHLVLTLGMLRVEAEEDGSAGWSLATAAAPLWDDPLMVFSSVRRSTSAVRGTWVRKKGMEGVVNGEGYKKKKQTTKTKRKEDT
jgi:hypothetical protein